MTTVTLPSSVITIGAYAFSRCSLSSIEIPGLVRQIDTEAFSHNPLTRFAFPEGIQEVDASVLYSCEELRSVTIPSSTNSIKGHWGDGISYSFMVRMMGQPPITLASLKRGLKVEVPSEFFDEYDNAINWQTCDLRKRKHSIIKRKKSTGKQVSWSVGIWGIVGVFVSTTAISALLMVWEWYFLGGLVLFIGSSVLTKIMTGKWID